MVTSLSVQQALRGVRFKAKSGKTACGRRPIHGICHRQRFARTLGRCPTARHSHGVRYRSDRSGNFHFYLDHQCRTRICLPKVGTNDTCHTTCPKRPIAFEPQAFLQVTPTHSDRLEASRQDIRDDDRPCSRSAPNVCDRHGVAITEREVDTGAQRIVRLREVSRLRDRGDLPARRQRSRHGVRDRHACKSHDPQHHACATNRCQTPFA